MNPARHLGRGAVIDFSYAQAERYAVGFDMWRAFGPVYQWIRFF